MTHLKDRQTFADQVYAILAAIPAGKVVTYGQIAKMAGLPSYIRQVCFVLRHLPSDHQFPCHRVINAQGHLSVQGETYQRYKQRLIDEGIEFNHHDKIDLKKYGWHI
ncbi:O(6)-alkylguanine repair protein YbaZ [Orbus hercynius]|uniref:O(6)-alkylguanine repair protein YbaZ n=2 Tax=Orbus hercynius TaxID=593135 RepID=A0A495RK66_9GAMM|nr:O(6)-alkylguanine repair protein YbaZ [Orbus hercynius]